MDIVVKIQIQCSLGGIHTYRYTQAKENTYIPHAHRDLQRRIQMQVKHIHTLMHTHTDTHTNTCNCRYTILYGVQNHLTEKHTHTVLLSALQPEGTAVMLVRGNHMGQEETGDTSSALTDSQDWLAYRAQPSSTYT